MPRGRQSRASRPDGPLLVDTPIPDKLYFRIGEVSELTQTKTYVLRYWETEFPMLKPVKSPAGHRLYRREDVQTVLEIKRLLYARGFTIEGARKQLANHPSAPEAQKDLFHPSVDSKHLERIREELRGILTILSREC
jgi:DNA-binding transcriptional MerR regulator